MNDLITIENAGPELVSTNYWQTDHARLGYAYLSINAGCFRLLAPTGKGLPLDDMKTGKVVLITRGPWPEAGKHDALEILFEDGSDSPFVLNIVAEQVDRLPLDADRDRDGQPPRWTFAVYNEQGKQFERPARYRKAKRLPYLKPWRE